jgi:RNA polymerase sigma-70 factor (ECF subfamily)
MTNKTDENYIELTLKGDANAFAFLVEKYKSMVFTLAVKIVKSKEEAEEVSQDAFIKAFKNIESYKNEVAFGAWLKRIVINQSIDRLKKNKLELVSINEEIYKMPVYDEDWQVESTISVESIVDGINSLKEKYRLVLTLYLLEGYDHQEISEVLNITAVTSRTNLLRGKKILREQLKTNSYATGY